MLTLDAKDHGLLQALRTNARMTVESLAREIGLSRTATHDRMLRLEGAKVIKRYTILIDNQALNNHHAIFVIRFAPDARNGDIASNIRQRRGVQATYCLAGDEDMFIEVIAGHRDELLALRDEVMSISGIASVQINAIRK